MFLDRKIKIGLVQMQVATQPSVSMNKSENMIKAEKMIKEAVSLGAKVVVLPEMFNCPYDNKLFREYSELEGGDSFKRLSKIALENQIVLIAGSMPEIDGEKIYNTSYSFDTDGRLLGKHRKAHLFNINVEGGQKFSESEVLTAGDTATVFDTKYGKIGVGICFDVRFPELSRIMADRGAEILIYPGAFNMTTGPAHWELLFRTRAVDNQLFTVGTAPARDINGSYVSYANSIIVDPWGTIVGRLEDGEGILVKEIDLGKVESIRRQLPVMSGRRLDIK